MQDFAEVSVDSELLFDDGHEDVNADSDPDLSAHRVERRAEERFDPKMLFDPLEEDFDVPSAAIEICDGECRKNEVVGQQNDAMLEHLVVEDDASKRIGIQFLRRGSIELDRVIASEPGLSVDMAIRAETVIEIAFGGNNEERHVDSERVEPLEVGVAAIEQIESSGLDRDLVEEIDVVKLAIRDVDEARNRATQIDLRVQLDGALAPAKPRPRKEGEAEVDGRRIESVDRLLQFHAERVVGVELARTLDEGMSEIGINAPVARFVGIGEGAASNVSTEAGVIELCPHCTQTDLDIAQPIAIRELGKGHAEELVEAREVADAMIAFVSSDASVEGVLGQEIQKLREDTATCVHRPPLSASSQKKDGKRHERY